MVILRIKLVTDQCNSSDRGRRWKVFHCLTASIPLYVFPLISYYQCSILKNILRTWRKNMYIYMNILESSKVSVINRAILILLRVLEHENKCWNTKTNRKQPQEGLGSAQGVGVAFHFTSQLHLHGRSCTFHSTSFLHILQLFVMWWWKQLCFYVSW